MSDLDRDHRDRPLVSVSVPLDNGDHLVEAIIPDGDAWLWILRPQCEDCETDTAHSLGPRPSHEQLGRLSKEWRTRIWGQPRCGQPRADGQPCRAEVRRDGDTCHHHHHHHRTGTDPETNERNTTP